MAKFPAGQTLITATLIAHFAGEPDAATAAANALTRHLNGDWGDLNDEDKQANDQALTTEARLLSAYHLPDGQEIYIITEADRSVTTILFAEDY